jgi:hypothetical protein
MKVKLMLPVFKTFRYGIMAIGSKTDVSASIPNKIEFQREGDQDKNTEAAGGKTKGNIIQN